MLDSKSWCSKQKMMSGRVELRDALFADFAVDLETEDGRAAIRQIIKHMAHTKSYSDGGLLNSIYGDSHSELPSIGSLKQDEEKSTEPENKLPL